MSDKSPHTLALLHYLGLSNREWTETPTKNVQEVLEEGAAFLTLVMDADDDTEPPAAVQIAAFDREDAVRS